jgi:hypothetical protein
MKPDMFVPMAYVSHATEYEFALKYRVPMWTADGEYSINVGQYETRYYTDETLPSEIKVSVAMINAFPFKPLADWEVTDYTVYVNTQDSKLDDIGWRVTQKMYVIVMERSSLDHMRITK